MSLNEDEQVLEKKNILNLFLHFYTRKFYECILWKLEGLEIRGRHNFWQVTKIEVQPSGHRNSLRSEQLPRHHHGPQKSQPPCQGSLCQLCGSHRQQACDQRSAFTAFIWSSNILWVILKFPFHFESPDFLSAFISFSMDLKSNNMTNAKSTWSQGIVGPRLASPVRLGATCTAHLGAMVPAPRPGQESVLQQVTLWNGALSPWRQTLQFLHTSRE